MNKSTGSIQAQKSSQYLATPIQNPQPVFGVEVTAVDDNDELDVPAAASGASKPICVVCSTIGGFSMICLLLSSTSWSRKPS